MPSCHAWIIAATNQKNNRLYLIERALILLQSRRTNDLQEGAERPPVHLVLHAAAVGAVGEQVAQSPHVERATQSRGSQPQLFEAQVKVGTGEYVVLVGIMKPLCLKE